MDLSIFRDRITVLEDLSYPNMDVLDMSRLILIITGIGAFAVFVFFILEYFDYKKFDVWMRHINAVIYHMLDDYRYDKKSHSEEPDVIMSRIKSNMGDVNAAYNEKSTLLSKQYVYRVIRTTIGLMICPCVVFLVAMCIFMIDDMEYIHKYKIEIEEPVEEISTEILEKYIITPVEETEGGDMIYMIEERRDD